METQTSPHKVTADDVLKWLSHPGRNEEEKEYLAYHGARLAFLLNLVTEYVATLEKKRSGAVRILDVGPHFLTTALRYQYGRQIVLNTLGWANERLAPQEVVDRHFEFDLNDAQSSFRWLPGEPHDLIVMGEVIEHLYTSPRLVLSFLRTLLAENGVMIIQTPNAVSLAKRLKMVIGRQPYEMIRETRENPGHFREYTADELKRLCQDVSLTCERVCYTDYWPSPRILKRIAAVCPPLRGGLTVVARNVSS